MESEMAGGIVARWYIMTHLRERDENK